ncbi:MAG: DUF1007 family protein [Spirochaetes bacterium]|nr:DUF1007 family protein [Spirochaetota bacterium]
MFDQVFSASIKREFDSDRNGSFSEKENDKIRHGAFENLKHYGYFIFIRKGTSRLNPETVSGFRAEIINGKTLHYHFYVPVTKYGLGNDFFISVFDRTFYCAIDLGKQPITNSDAAEICSYKVETNKKYPIYYNPQGSPDDLTIYKSWKAGLETAYPEELHVMVK